jgi:NADH-quinone oxidoreductase subunit C
MTTDNKDNVQQSRQAPAAQPDPKQAAAERAARVAAAKRAREGATEEKPKREPSPLEPAVREALKDLGVEVDYSLDEMVVRAAPDRNVEVLRTLKTTVGLEFTYLRCLLAVDYVEELEVVYLLSSLKHPHKVMVKVRLPGVEEPHLRSATAVWHGADWHEREAHDLLGIVFDGHPDMSPLLLFEGFEGHPLRKSYEIAEQQERLGD